MATKKHKRSVTRFEVQLLPVKLTTDELLERGQQLAQVEQSLSDHERHADSVKKDLTAKRTSLQAERSRLSRIVTDKAEQRDVRVTVTVDYDERELTQMRNDTGEVVYRRGLRAEELQEAFDLSNARVESST